MFNGLEESKLVCQGIELVDSVDPIEIDCQQPLIISGHIHCPNITAEPSQIVSADELCGSVRVHKDNLVPAAQCALSTIPIDTLV